MDVSDNLVNKNVDQVLSFLNTKAKLTQTYSGIDVKCIMYLPLITRGKTLNKDKPSIAIFADLQTFSISSTRSVTPVRVLGRSSPVTYTRGARTFAGTLSFAAINKDAFADIYDVDISESYVNASTSMVSDQLPPFSIVLTVQNESGGAAMHAVHGVTLVNYGTTYSIDNLYTETTYTYVATDVSPMIQNREVVRIDTQQGVFKTASQIITDELKEKYSSSKKSLYDEIIHRMMNDG